MRYPNYGRYVLILAFLISGCAGMGKGMKSTTASKRPRTPGASIAGEGVKTPSPGIQVIESSPETDAGALPVKGMAFARTIFEGIVKTSFVQLTIVREGKGEHSYPLMLGEKAKQGNFPWEIKAVESGFFVIQLPEGAYRITSVGIPVGTTLAVEDIDITFSVAPDVVSYIGTLKIFGTKEKIKIGGVPVIKPGFEYTAQILDERTTALEEFRARFPEYEGKILAELMQLGPVVQPQTQQTQNIKKEE